MNNDASSRPRARLIAVQALYQMELSSADLSEILEQYNTSGVLEDEGEDTQAPADFKHFEKIMRGVMRHQIEIDQAINHALAEGWVLARLDATLRAILRAGVFELLHCPYIPHKVAINEYLEVAHAFFSEGEPGVVNAVLDKIGHQLGVEQG